MKKCKDFKGVNIIYLTQSSMREREGRRDRREERQKRGEREGRRERREEREKGGEREGRREDWGRRKRKGRVCIGALRVIIKFIYITCHLYSQPTLARQ